MNNITVDHLLELVSQIIPGSTYDYARPGANKARLISVDITSAKIQMARVSEDGTLTHSSISSDSLNTLASRIVEDTPISIDEALLNGGNQRSVIEALLLRTTEFYSCKVGRNKNIVWVPSKPHKVGEHLVINVSDLPLDSKGDSVIYNISELFAAYLKNEGKSEATIDRYVKQVPNNNKVRDFVNSIAGTKDLFDVIEIPRLLKISQIVASEDFDKNGGNMYSAGINAYIHFINNYNLFLNHIAKGNKNTPILNSIPSKFPLQQIFYGAPGTGKSHKVKEVTDKLPKSDVFRTTFHPDSDYSTFIGCYKPKMVKAPIRDSSGHEITSACEEEKKRIAYEYEPQAFLKAYVRAYETNEPVFLVIEEINRGNCAQIFGDMFQLLDRNENGESDYAIKPETAIQEFLNEKLKDCDIDDETIKSGAEMRLPANLYIWATMNTSDQSLFPIDSAFKRRWDWKYMPIKYSNKDWKINLAGNTSVEWVKLQQELNELIYDATESEDKMLGDWFVKANTNNEISEEELVGKIIFYLWNDVARVDAGNLFNLEIEKHGRKCKVTFSDFYNNNGSINSDVVKKWLKQIKVLKEPAEDRQDTPDNETSSTANSPIDQE